MFRDWQIDVCMHHLTWMTIITIFLPNKLSRKELDETSKMAQFKKHIQSVFSHLYVKQNRIHVHISSILAVKEPIQKRLRHFAPHPCFWGRVLCYCGSTSSFISKPTRIDYSVFCHMSTTEIDHMRESNYTQTTYLKMKLFLLADYHGKMFKKKLIFRSNSMDDTWF